MHCQLLSYKDKISLYLASYFDLVSGYYNLHIHIENVMKIIFKHADFMVIHKNKKESLLIFFGAKAPLGQQEREGTNFYFFKVFSISNNFLCLSRSIFFYLGLSQSILDYLGLSWCIL